MGKHAPTPTTKKFKHKPTQPPMYPNNTRSFTFAVVAVFFAVHMVEATRKAPRPRAHWIATAPCTLQVLQGAPPPRVKTAITSTEAVTRATRAAVFKWMQLSVVCQVNLWLTQMTGSVCCKVAVVILALDADCIVDEASGAWSTWSALGNSETSMEALVDTRAPAWPSRGSLSHWITVQPAFSKP